MVFGKHEQNRRPTVNLSTLALAEMKREFANLQVGNWCLKTQTDYPFETKISFCGTERPMKPTPF